MGVFAEGSLFPLSFQRQSNASQALCDIIRLGRDQGSQLQEAVEPDPLLITLESWVIVGHGMVGLTKSWACLGTCFEHRRWPAISNSESDEFLRFRAQKGIPLEALVVQAVGTSGIVYYASFEYYPGFEPGQSQNEAPSGSMCCGILWGRECPCIMSVCLLCQAVTSACAQQAGLCGAASEEHVWWGSDGELPGQWDAGAACLAGTKACWVSLSLEKQHTLSLCHRI